jgi:integrase/recombinase XerD
VTLVPLAVDVASSIPTVRVEPLDRLPGTADDEPFLRLGVHPLIGATT